MKIGRSTAAMYSSSVYLKLDVIDRLQVTYNLLEQSTREHVVVCYTNQLSSTGVVILPLLVTL